MTMAIVFIVLLVIIVGLSTYLALKESKNTIISKSILYRFEHEHGEDLNKLIKFSKLNKSKYQMNNKRINKKYKKRF